MSTHLIFLCAILIACAEASEFCAVRVTAGSNETWAQELQRYVSYFKKPNYQKVDIGEKGRPLVFSFGRDINQTHLQDLRAATKQAIGVYPYTVSMNGQSLPEIDAQSTTSAKPSTAASSASSKESESGGPSCAACRL